MIHVCTLTIRTRGRAWEMSQALSDELSSRTRQKLSQEETGYWESYSHASFRPAKNAVLLLTKGIMSPNLGVKHYQRPITRQSTPHLLLMLELTRRGHLHLPWPHSLPSSPRPSSALSSACLASQPSCAAGELPSLPSALPVSPQSSLAAPFSF